ncbi:MAG: LysR family transcriptional regulator [Gammaproteobacteria bacterium]|nr:LysR family transcriptional regulator [Gammaproteobacteria bacterium]
MHVTLRQLKVFASVARHMSYTRAAEDLHLSQPAVSMQIKQLEGNVGLRLFEQLGRGIHLTEAGQEVYQCSRVIQQQLDDTSSVLEQMKGMQRGHLKLAVASTANYFATRLIATFSQRVEHLAVSLDVTNREGLLNDLENNETDLVIMGKPPEELDLVAEQFMDNPLVVIAATGHAFVNRRRIPLTDLQSETFVVREPASGTRIAMERFFAEKGVRLRTGMEMRSNEAVQQAVQAGLGLGIVSIHTLELELETRRLAVLDVEGFPIMRQWYIVHRAGKRFSPVAQAFKSFVLEEAATLWHPPGQEADAGSRAG